MRWPFLFSFCRLITSHLLKEILPSCILVFAVLTILVLCQQVSRNSELFFSPIINGTFSLQILVSLLPPILTFTLPVSIVLGEIITLSRLAVDHEWIALQASGLNKITRLGPFLLVGIFGFALSLTLNWSLAPKTIVILKDIRKILSLRDATFLIQPQTFISEFPGILLKINAINRQTRTWDKVLLLRKSENSTKFQLLAAKSGSLSVFKDNGFNSFEIKLSNGVLIENFTSEKDHITSAFKENIIKVKMAKHIVQDYSTNLLSPVQLTSMWDLIYRLKQHKGDSQSATKEVKIEILKRFTNAFACIFASLCALVITTKSYGRNIKRFILLLLSFLLLATYQASLTFGQNLAYKETLPIIQTVLISLSIPFLALAITYIAISQAITIDALTLLTSIKSAMSIRALIQRLDLEAHLNHNKNLPQVNFGHYIIIFEFAKLLALSLFILVVTVLLFTLLDIAPSIAKNNIKLDLVIRYLFGLSPQIIYYIIPFGILIAAVTAGVTLARTGQLSILLYYSVDPLRLIFPIVIITILIYLSILFLSETILPRSNREQDNLYRTIKGKAAEETTVSLDHQWLSNEGLNTIYGFRALEEFGIKKMRILIIKFSNQDYYLSEVLYITGLDMQRRIITEQSGFRYRIGKEGLAEFAFLDQEALSAEVSKIENLPEKTYREASKMSMKQLQQYISQIEQVGFPTTSLRMDKMQKIAFPFTCITMLFLAFPLCLLQLRRQYQSSLFIIAVSISLALLFWGILSVFEAAGKRGTLPITIAAWSPHALFLALASTIHLKLSH